MSIKKKQGLLLTVAIVLILVGIFQQDLGRWGNNILSNIFPAGEIETGKNATKDPKSTDDPKSTGDPKATENPNATDDPFEDNSNSAVPVGAEPLPSNSTGKVEYFSSERIDRDASRGRLKSEYEKITKDNNASNAVKTSAYDSIMELTKMSEAEKKIEMLVKEKGYEDCFACFSDSGEIDIIVKADSLTGDKVAQITDIVSRHGNVTLDKIHLRNVK